MELDTLIAYLFRWIHFFAGVAWIGLLYYFNFVQTEYFKEADATAKSSAISKLVPRALWWFRYGALFTFLSGLALAGFLGAAVNFYIIIGMLLGTLMFLNVWIIIWPNQKIVIASNEQVLGGGEADPAAAGALAKAGLASRTNTLFSAHAVLHGRLRPYGRLWPGSHVLRRRSQRDGDGAVSVDYPCTGGQCHQRQDGAHGIGGRRDPLRRGIGHRPVIVDAVYLARTALRARSTSSGFCAGTRAVLCLSQISVKLLPPSKLPFTV
jgi:hypothetical protein